LGEQICPLVQASLSQCQVSEPKLTLYVQSLKAKVLPTGTLEGSGESVLCLLYLSQAGLGGLSCHPLHDATGLCGSGTGSEGLAGGGCRGCHGSLLSKGLVANLTRLHGCQGRGLPSCGGLEGGNMLLLLGSEGTRV
jgi:hypothetical protein